MRPRWYPAIAHLSWVSGSHLEKDWSIHLTAVGVYRHHGSAQGFSKALKVVADWLHLILPPSEQGPEVVLSHRLSTAPMDCGHSQWRGQNSKALGWRMSI
jgi:hypothetical protein